LARSFPVNLAFFEEVILPASMFKRVVFPAPELPNIAVT